MGKHALHNGMADIKLNNSNSQYFNNYIFETDICVTYKMLIEITIIFNWYGVTMTQLITFVPSYSCNNITLKTAAIAAETVDKIHHKHEVDFVGSLYTA